MNVQLSRFSVELSSETAQLLADFIGNATFETYASCATGKAHTYELRDAALELLAALKKQGFHYRPRVEQHATDQPQLQYAHIPLRHLGANATERVRDQLLRDIRTAISKGSCFPQWCVSDFDQELISIGTLAADEESNTIELCNCSEQAGLHPPHSEKKP